MDAALVVIRQKGFAATTVRDVAAEMGTSSGLIHHYFDSMDELLAAAFAQAAEEDLGTVHSAMQSADSPHDALRAFFVAYAPVHRDWAFQLWFEAWAEALRRPQLRETSRRLNVAWQQLIEATIEDGVAVGAFTCTDPRGAAWRILSLLDGLAIQVVAHDATLDRETALRWTAGVTELELGLPAGSLADVAEVS